MPMYKITATVTQNKTVELASFNEEDAARQASLLLSVPDGRVKIDKVEPVNRIQVGDEILVYEPGLTDKLNDMVETVERVERTPVALYCHVCDRNRPVVMRIAEGGYYIQDVYKDKDGNLTNEKPNPTVIGPFSYHCKCCGVKLVDSTYELERELSIPGAKELVAKLSDSVDDMPWDLRHFDEIKKKMEGK